jgi:hypothetical protein
MSVVLKIASDPSHEVASMSLVFDEWWTLNEMNASKKIFDLLWSRAF